jgi:hypothetical protein
MAGITPLKGMIISPNKNMSMAQKALPLSNNSAIMETHLIKPLHDSKSIIFHILFNR